MSKAPVLNPRIFVLGVNGLVLMGFSTSIGETTCRTRASKKSSVARRWTRCSHCGTRLQSKGMRPRQIQTLVGVVHWRRRVGRCPKGCQGSQVIPLDIALGIESYQQTSLELVRLGCLLAIFVPFETAAVIAQRFTGIKINAQTIWSWVQLWGKQAMNQLQEEITELARGQEPIPEAMESSWEQMPLVIGADGVMVNLNKSSLN